MYLLNPYSILGTLVDPEGSDTIEGHSWRYSKISDISGGVIFSDAGVAALLETTQCCHLKNQYHQYCLPLIRIPSHEDHKTETARA